VIANPGDLEKIVSDHHHKQVTAIADAKRHAEAERRVAEVRNAGQEVCIMFGVPLWPRPGNEYGTYDYDQLRAAIWTFRDWVNWLDKGYSPGSKAIMIRNMIRWLVEHHRRVTPTGHEPHPSQKALQLIGTIARLYEKAPDAECSMHPIAPHIEGQW
jgi:hypothetical protein